MKQLYLLKTPSVILSYFLICACIFFLFLLKIIFILERQCIPCSQKELKFKAAIKAAGKMVKNINADAFSYLADGEDITDEVTAKVNDDGVLEGALELSDVCDSKYVFFVHHVVSSSFELIVLNIRLIMRVTKEE